MVHFLMGVLRSPTKMSFQHKVTGKKQKQNNKTLFYRQTDLSSRVCKSGLFFSFLQAKITNYIFTKIWWFFAKIFWKYAELFSKIFSQKIDGCWLKKLLMLHDFSKIKKILLKHKIWVGKAHQAEIFFFIV